MLQDHHPDTGLREQTVRISASFHKDQSNEPINHLDRKKHGRKSHLSLKIDKFHKASAIPALREAPSPLQSSTDHTVSVLSEFLWWISWSPGNQRQPWWWLIGSLFMVSSYSERQRECSYFGGWLASGSILVSMICFGKGKSRLFWAVSAETGGSEASRAKGNFSPGAASVLAYFCLLLWQNARQRQLTESISLAHDFRECSHHEGIPAVRVMWPALSTHFSLFCFGFVGTCPTGRMPATVWVCHPSHLKFSGNSLTDTLRAVSPRCL